MSVIRRRSLAGSWMRFCALRKMTGIRPEPLPSSVRRCGNGLPARRLPGRAGCPSCSRRGWRWAAPEIALLLVHLEEEQVGELFDVVAVGDAVVAQDVAVVPEALDDGGGFVVIFNSPSSNTPNGVFIGYIGYFPCSSLTMTLNS